jgi:hypothetical protein
MESWEAMFEKAITLMLKHGLGDWNLRIENMRNPYRFANAEGGPLDVIGYCSQERKTIYIHSGCPDRHFRQTVLHEIAHALTPEDFGHGEEWCDTALNIGCTYKHVWRYQMALDAGEQ